VRGGRVRGPNGRVPGPRPRARGHLGRAEIAIAARDLRRGAPPTGAGAIEVRDVSIDIVRGEITVIAGRPGSGKSALLRLLAGLDRPSAGSVWIGERRIDAGPGSPHWRFWRDELAFVGAGWGGVAAPGTPAVLSMLAAAPDHVYLDEPAPGVAKAGLERVHAALRALTAIHGRTALVATARQEVAAWADRLLVVDRGALVLDLESPTPAEAAVALAGVSAR
jgi:ABC-type lipoprotein export system ATPase subunit